MEKQFFFVAWGGGGGGGGPFQPPKGEGGVFRKRGSIVRVVRMTNDAEDAVEKSVNGAPPQTSLTPPALERTFVTPTSMPQKDLHDVAIILRHVC